MRATLWFLALFGIAVASALLLGDNQGTVSIFSSPHRIDLSINLTLLLLLLLFLVMHLALRALAALFSMPDQARRWRSQRRERALHLSLLDALSHLAAGRFIRSRKSAEQVLLQEQALALGGEALTYSGRLRTVAHLLLAESAHALQDKTARQSHLKLALDQSTLHETKEEREGVQLFAARWALDDRDALDALQWLDQLPHAAGRRTVALRLRLKVTRLAGQHLAALETARLLSKHRAFSSAEAVSLVQSLVLELLGSAHDAEQLLHIWQGLEVTEREMAEVAMDAATRMLQLGGEIAWSRQCLLPVWDQLMSQPVNANSEARNQLIRLLAGEFVLATGAPDAAWLNRIEAAQMRQPGDAHLLYLAGITCMRLELWGKAQLLLKQCLPLLKDLEMRRHAWLAVAELAEQRQDDKAALEAYRRAVN